jgi:ribosomal protein S18 acetylase RimI-like enzyme
VWKSKITRNKFYILVLDLIDHYLGIKKSKVFLYKKDLTVLEPESKIKSDSSIHIRVCNIEDIDRSSLTELNKMMFKNRLKNENIMIAAFHHSDIVGYAWISFQKVWVAEIEKTMEFNGGYNWGVFVFPKYRRKSIGKKLVKYRLNIARKKGAHSVYSIIETNNTPSQKMVQSLGFKKQKIISFYKLFNKKRWWIENRP